MTTAGPAMIARVLGGADYELRYPNNDTFTIKANKSDTRMWLPADHPNDIYDADGNKVSEADAALTDTRDSAALAFAISTTTSYVTEFCEMTRNECSQRNHTTSLAVLMHECREDLTAYSAIIRQFDSTNDDFLKSIRGMTLKALTHTLVGKIKA
jgi:hypothetical protein